MELLHSVNQEEMFVKVNKYRAVMQLALLLLAPIVTLGQDFDADIEAIVAKVGAAENYSIETTVKVYSKKGGSLQHQLKATIMASKSITLTIMGEIEMLQTSSQIIVVDRDEHLIEVENIPASKQSKGKKNGKNAIQLDELEKLSKGDSGLKFTLTNTTGNIRTYAASNAKAGIKSIVIKLDAVEKKLVSYAVEQVDENGNVEQYTLVEYTSFAYSISSPELLKTSHFIVSDGGAYKASAAYKGYKVIKK